MSHFNKLLCATLAIAFVGSADTGGKSPSNGKTALNAPSKSSPGWSAWRSVFVARNGVVNPQRPKDFDDTRFEYRWKSERNVSFDVCTIEIRPTDDLDDSYTAPQIGVGYSDQSHGLMQTYRARDVLITRLAHVFLRPTDCGRVGMVFWSK